MSITSEHLYVALGMFLQALVLAYTYGKLTQRVKAIEEKLAMIWSVIESHFHLGKG